MNSLFLVVLVLLALGWQAARRPVSRRMALRNARRRLVESLLVVAGTTLGAALITGSLIVGDTLEASHRVTASTQLGPVDEMMTVHDDRHAARLARLVGHLDAPIDGVTTIVTAPASASAAVDGTRRAEPKAELVEADFDEVRAFGGDPQATGISGATPTRGEAVITTDVARALNVGAGDRIMIHLYGRQMAMEVAGVLERFGLAGFQPDQFRSTSPNIFVAPGTISEIALESPLPEGTMPPHVRVLVSNQGGVEDGARYTDEVTGAIENALPDDAPLVVEPLKQKRLVAARSSGDFYGKMFVSVGAFALIAGILLLVSIFVMLAEDRKRELGMIRAVGMRRADLVRAFVLEGSAYALLAGGLGTLLGIGVGWGIVKIAAPIFGDAGDFSLTFAAGGESVATGFGIGVLLAIATVFFTSLRIARLNVIRAIRDLPEAAGGQVRKSWYVVAALAIAAGVVATLAGWPDRDAWQAAMLGPLALAAGLHPFVSRLIGGRRSLTLLSLVALVWAAFGNSLSDGRFFTEAEISAFVVQGVVSTFAGVILLSQLQQPFGTVLRAVGARFLALRLATSYPIANRLRTGLTLAMYSLVVFTLVFTASLSGMFAGQVDRLTRELSGGFDLVVTANAANSPRLDELDGAVDDGRVVAALAGTVMFERAGKEPQGWWATGVGRDFVSGPVPALARRAGRFASDREAWNALIDEPGSVIVPPMFLHVGGDMAKAPAPGDVLRTVDPMTGTVTKLRVVGLLDGDPTNMGAVVSHETLRTASPGTVSTSRFYVDLGGSASDAERVADRLQGDFVENGVEARTFRGIVEASQRSSLQFLRLMQGFLALGLVVGIAGLGIVMVRAVRERRRHIGTLRSLGFVASRVRRVFLFESAFVALEGIAVGAVLGLVTASQLAGSGNMGQGVSFAVPWTEVVLLGLTSFAVSLAATAWPAVQAAHVPPATALRIAD